MTIDYSALLYDPVYAELGVEATLTVEGTAGEVAITVIDDTRPKTITSGSSEVRSVGPGAYARIPELVENGIEREDYLGAVLEFNSRSWEVRSYELRGSPNGEDVGEVRFFLKAAVDSGISAGSAIGAAAGAGTAIAIGVGVVAGVDPFWTVFTATEPSGEGTAHVGVGTRKIYVSATGNDSNLGTEASPMLTLSAGMAALRDGKPDWLLLKRGDTWTDEVLGVISKVGLSSTEPMLISSYGTGARPLIKSNSTSGDCVLGGLFGTTGMDNMAVVGIEFYAYTRDPDSPSFDLANVTVLHDGIRLVSDATWLLIEDCKFSFYQNNLTLQRIASVAGTFRLRRNVIHDSYGDGAGAHSVGLYMARVQSPYLEENIWIHNGFNDSAALTGALGGKTVFNRNVYIQGDGSNDCGPGAYMREINLQSCSEGAQYRSGGTVTDNLVVSAGSAGIQVGSGTDITPTVINCVVMDSIDLEGGNARGWGILALHSVAGTTISNNIVSQMGSGPLFGKAFITGAECVNVSITDNIVFDWDDFIDDNGISTITSGNQIDLNGDNVEFSFPNPTRTAGDYYGSIGGSPATLEGLITALKLQRKDNWNDLLQANVINDYIRAGFGL